MSEFGKLTRMIDGKRFVRQVAYESKVKAKRRAKYFRTQGWLARVMPQKYYTGYKVWIVYTRRKK